MSLREIRLRRLTKSHIEFGNSMFTFFRLQPDVMDTSSENNSGPNMPGSSVASAIDVNTIVPELKNSSVLNSEAPIKKEKFQQSKDGVSSQDVDFYELLPTNEYVDIDPASLKSSVTFWCKCPLPPKGQNGCVSDCENRSKRVECELPLCKAGDQCSNRVSDSRSCCSRFKNCCRLFKIVR